MNVRLFGRSLAAAYVAAAIATPGPLHSASLQCDAKADLVRLSQPLKHVAARLTLNEEVRIVALGSSSTFGTGASKPEFSYPTRLQAELHARLPAAKFTVLNRGIGGEDARQMLPRLKHYLEEEKPHLVLWQVGTNALLAESGVEQHAPLILEGINKIRSAGADAILMDPQYAPYVLRDADARPMVHLLARLAEETHVSVFRRFALMEHWHEADGLAMADFLAPDLFHMNDWSYGCVARALAAAVVEAATPGPQGPVVAAGIADPRKR